MIYIYIGVPVFCLLLALIFKGYKKELFTKLDTKEHPLRFLYPASARVFDLFRSLHPCKQTSNTSLLMKQLCVKENVDAEMYIYSVKKISTAAGIFLAACIVGMLLCISGNDSGLIKNLERAAYGKGQTSYQLNVEYDNTTETMDIVIDEAQYTEEEIIRIFDENYDDIILELLGKNESADNVCYPLNLMSSYNDIEIKWEIEDTSLLDYNGDISDSIEENEFIPVNLYATFTIDDTNEVYCIPLILTAPTVSAQELLLQNIYESIELNNSIYDDEVVLPQDINGQAVTFSTIKENDALTFFILGAVGAIAIFIAYDKTLESKIKKRQEQMALDFTEIVFKLGLLYEAGLSIYMAWERIISEQEMTHPGSNRWAYQEMKLTAEKIKSGVSEAECYSQFGKRCGLHQYIKLGNILEQNLHKGTRGMKNLLKSEAQDSFETRKRLARKKGEEASTKMLVPMIMMLVIVIIIVAVPALMTMEF